LCPKKSDEHSSNAKPSSNRTHEYREELGLSKVELARLASLSDKTIARVERSEQRFRSVTYRRIFNALNKARREEGLAELVYEQVFPQQE
jgi:predicted transcriptional regulator